MVGEKNPTKMLPPQSGNQSLNLTDLLDLNMPDHVVFCRKIVDIILSLIPLPSSLIYTRFGPSEVPHR